MTASYINPDAFDPGALWIDASEVPVYVEALLSRGPGGIGLHLYDEEGGPVGSLYLRPDFLDALLEHVEQKTLAEVPA